MPPKKGKEPIAEVYDSVTDGLKSLYRTKIRPVEEQFKFGEWQQPEKFPKIKCARWYANIRLADNSDCLVNPE